MILLDRNADTFPVGLAGTPFEEVYRALRIVAATVWDVDPLAYRAGMAWGWYALHDPAALSGFRDVVTAALISAVAPMVKDTQTDAELMEYLRQWRSYIPTFPKLQALYALFGAVVDIQPISDPESQAVLPVDDTRLAFYVRIESIDFSRPLSLEEAREIAVRATPLGSRPYPYYALETRIPCTVSLAPVGIYIRIENWEAAAPPPPPPVEVMYCTFYDYYMSGHSWQYLYDLDYNKVPIAQGDPLPTYVKNNRYRNDTQWVTNSSLRISTVSGYLVIWNDAEGNAAVYDVVVRR